VLQGGGRWVGWEVRGGGGGGGGEACRGGMVRRQWQRKGEVCAKKCKGWSGKWHVGGEGGRQKGGVSSSCSEGGWKGRWEGWRSVCIPQVCPTIPAFLLLLSARRRVLSPPSIVWGMGAGRYRDCPSSLSPAALPLPSGEAGSGRQSAQRRGAVPEETAPAGGMLPHKDCPLSVHIQVCSEENTCMVTETPEEETLMAQSASG